MVSPRTEPPASDARLSRLAASLAHNVNNALTGVIGYLELALRETPRGGPAEGHMLSSLRCAQQAAEAVWRVVSFMDRPRGPGQPAAVSLWEAAATTAEAVRREGRPGLEVRLGGDPTARAWADGRLLGQALEPLVHNAVEAMPAGGTLALEVASHGGRCSLSISDSGPGIPGAVLARLFEPFVTTKTSGHLGLGLAQCRDLVVSLGGDLRVTSAEGRGTTVTVVLPAAVDQAPVTESVAAPALAWPTQASDWSKAS
jgi:signal transduction histidine kinase